MVELGPGTHAHTPTTAGIDVRTLTAARLASYRITNWMSIFAGYVFLQQRSTSAPTGPGDAPLASDADENRVPFDSQIGHPIRLD